MTSFRTGYRALARRVTRARLRVLLLRSMWLAALVPLAASLSAALVDWQPHWPAIGLLSAAVFAVSLAAGSRGARDAARGPALDRRFRLADLLVTALEVDRRGPASEVERRLLQDAAGAVAALADRRQAVAPAWRREAETLLGVVLLAAGVSMMAGGGRFAVPPRLPTLEAGFQGGGSGPGSGAGAGEQRGVAGTGLGDAAGHLADQAAALGLAEAMSAGDAAEAAREARSLGERSDEMTEAGRRALAEAMGGAADASAETEPDVAEALRAAARALNEEEGRDARQGFDALADALERQAARPGAPGAARRAPRTKARPEAAARLGDDGVLAGLSGSGDGSGRRIATGPGEAGATQPGSAAVGAVGGAGPAVVPGPVEAGTDLLVVPWAWRDLVRAYFARGAAAP